MTMPFCIVQYIINSLSYFYSFSHELTNVQLAYDHKNRFINGKNLLKLANNINKQHSLCVSFL